MVAGPAGRVNAWLWRRGDDAAISSPASGRPYDHFREAVSHPIN